MLWGARRELMQGVAEINQIFPLFADEADRFCNLFQGTFVLGAASFRALSRI